MKDDWRIMGQQEYLSKKKMIYSSFEKSCREHDHCEFCGRKFSMREGFMHEGYCTEDYYYWVCEKCFNDFKDQFMWVIDTT